MKVPLHPVDEHNERLLAHTHPPEWENHEPNNPYNLVVIGAGTAGLVAAAGAVGLGAHTALVEKALMGGDCLNYGCVPSKALIRCATAMADTRAAPDYHVRITGDASIDFSGVMERMRRLRADISRNDAVGRFSALNVNVFLGTAAFTGPRTLQVDGKELRFSRALIATGARASAPPIEGLEEAGYLTNETLFNLTELPKRLAVIGAGPIGCEMAQAFQRFGARVTLLEINDQIMIKEDRDAADLVAGVLTREDIGLVLSLDAIVRVDTRGEDKVIVYRRKGSQEEEEVAADAILVSAGRNPNVEGLGLEAAGVTFDPRAGVEVNDRLQTSNPRIFAAGDVCSKYQFTHAADFLARTVLANALFAGRRKASALTIPWCTYTDPQVAHVGLTEHAAAQEGVDIDTYKVPLDDVDRAILDGETEGFVKIHVAKGKDRIVGATIVARHAGDMIGEIVLALKQGIGLGSLADVIHPYPTQAEAIRKAGDQYNKTRLTPFVKKLFQRWLTWQRNR